MAKVVNLRTARKQRARDAARREKVVRAPGVDAAEAGRAAAEVERERRRLDAHRRDEPER